MRRDVWIVILDGRDNGHKHRAGQCPPACRLDYSSRHVGIGRTRGLNEEISQSNAFVIGDVGQTKRAKAAVIWRCGGGRGENVQTLWPGAGRAKMTGAKMTGAKLTGAKMTGAKLTGAKMTGAKMTGARGPAGKNGVNDGCRFACHEGSTLSGVPRVTRGADRREGRRCRFVCVSSLFAPTLKMASVSS